MLLGLLLVAAASQAVIGDSQCRLDSKDFVFKRTFITKYYGPPAMETTDKQRVGRLHAQCLTADEHANNMIKHFESYGFNMDARRQDPFAEYEDDVFSSWLRISNPQTNYTILVSSSDGYASVENSPLTFSVWIIRLKKDYESLKGSLKENDVLSYGEYDFAVQGNAMCIRFMDPPGTTFRDFTIIPGVSPINFQLWNEDLGYGSARGVMTHKDGILDGNTVLTFPSEIS